MNVLVFGATGAAGGSVLLACLDSPHVLAEAARPETAVGTAGARSTAAGGAATG